jgi:hypothetical protein
VIKKDKTHLRVVDRHSCMASAPNLYFDTKLSKTGDEFFERQRALILSYTKARLGAHGIRLLALVECNDHIFKRTNDYVHNNVALGKWPIKTTTRHKKVIIDYYSPLCNEGHVEAAEFKDGVWYGGIFSNQTRIFFPIRQ